MKVIIIILAAIILSACDGGYEYPDFYSSKPCSPGMHLTTDDRGIPLCK